MYDSAGKYIQKIGSMGGAVTTIESGYMQEEIANRAYQYQKSIDSKETIIVGLNEYIPEEPALKAITRIDADVEKRERK